MIFSRRTVLRSVTAVLGLYFLVVGAGCVLLPEMLAGQFHIVPQGIHGMSTVRGDLGGLFVSMGLLTFVGLRSKRHGAAFLSCVAFVLIVIACARIPGLLLDGWDLLTFALLIVEALLATIFAFTARERDDASPG